MRSPIIVTMIYIFLYFACSSITVKSDYNPNVDFSSYKTYHWIDFVKMNDDDLTQNPLLRQRIVSCVDAELLKKGFILSDANEVDFFVVVHGLRRENVDISDWGGGYQYDPLWGGVEVSHVTQGTIVIDVVDAKSDELIWRGLGTCVIKDCSDTENLQKVANLFVSKVLSDFPPEGE